jgi:hypothetical protein
MMSPIAIVGIGFAVLCVALLVVALMSRGNGSTGQGYVPPSDPNDPANRSNYE